MPVKMMSPNTTLVWVPESAITDPYNPTATALNAGVNFSCAVVRGYTLGPTASDTDTTASICDEGNVENRTYANYEGSITMFRDANRADITSVFNVAWALFRTAGQRGFIYRRVGFKQNVPFAAGHEVEGFLFENDNPQTIDGGDGGGPIQFTVPFLQQGLYTGMVYVGPLTAPTVTAVAPANGSVTGGQSITLTGTNFLGVSAVRFGSNPAVAPLVVSATSMTVKAPPGAVGQTNVTVQNAAGTSPTAAGNQYTYSA